MANNNNLFNAALAGASAGVSSRWLSNPSSASYDSQATLIETFATAFDAAIAPIAGGGSRGQAETVQAICAAFWRDRIITSETDMNDAVSVLVALYTSLATKILADSGSTVNPLEPLPLVYWVQVNSVGTGGTAAVEGGVAPFPTITDAVAEFSPAVSCQLLVIAGDYSSEGVVDPSENASDVSITGIGSISPGLTLGGARLPPLLASQPIPLFLNGVHVTGDGVSGDCLSGFAFIHAYSSEFLTNVNCPAADGRFYECHFEGVVTLVTGAVFSQCTVAASFFNTPDAKVDYPTFLAFGLAGLQRTDTDPVWILGARPTPSDITVRYAALQDADRSIVFASGAIEGGVWCSGNTLSANRTVTVDVTGAPDLGFFRIYNFTQPSNETITVNGVVCEDGMCTILQIQTGALVLFAVELL
jgi:hypothetical protein